MDCEECILFTSDGENSSNRPDTESYPIDFIMQSSKTPQASTTTTIFIHCSHQQCSRCYSCNLVASAA